MKIVLSDDEVREALREKAIAKIGTQYTIDPDGCWIEVIAGANEVEDLEEVTFHANVEEVQGL